MSSRGDPSARGRRARRIVPPALRDRKSPATASWRGRSRPKHVRCYGYSICWAMAPATSPEHRRLARPLDARRAERADPGQRVRRTSWWRSVSCMPAAPRPLTFWRRRPRRGCMQRAAVLRVWPIAHIPDGGRPTLACPTMGGRQCRTSNRSDFRLALSAHCPTPADDGRRSQSTPISGCRVRTVHVVASSRSTPTCVRPMSRRPGARP
jgi:hypothetical protein